MNWNGPARSAGYNTIDHMRKQLFRLLARLNKVLLPTLWHKDLMRLSKLQKLIVAWRYYVTRNAL